ncbi:MAG: hypothetical protein LQ343_007461, partial [Gyalolechia ehrenbergii]
MSKLQQNDAKSLNAMGGGSASGATIVQRASKTSKSGKMAKKLNDRYFKGMEVATKPKGSNAEKNVLPVLLTT